jgi:hypothetical protein
LAIRLIAAAEFYRNGRFFAQSGNILFKQRD